MDACRPVFPYGHIFKPLSEPHLEEVAATLAREAKHATSSMIGVEVNIDKVLNVYLVPDGCLGALRCTMNGSVTRKRWGPTARPLWDCLAV